MDRVETIDRGVGAPFGWFFLMTHGKRVEPEVGQAVIKGIRDERVRLPIEMRVCYCAGPNGPTDFDATYSAR